MTHASSREKGALQIKKLKKAQRKKTIAWNNLTDEERAEITKARNAPDSNKKIIAHALYDLEKNQYPRTKYYYLLEVCEKRLREIEEEKENWNHAQNVEPEAIDSALGVLNVEKLKIERAREAIKNGRQYFG